MTGKLWHIAGLASQSGRSFLKAGVGLYNFATDGNVRSAAIANIQDTWDHLPRYTIRGMQAFSDMSTGQRVDAAIKFGFDSALSFGAGKVIGATGSVAYGGVSRAAQFIENSQLVWRPVDYSIGSLAVKKPLGMFERITTVTPEMSARFQGMGYLDLITNTFNVAPIGETMAVDHIFPSAEIAKLPGFNAVTKSQMTSIIRDSEGFGNLQPLPKTFNSSKGSLTNWNTYKGENLHPEYMNNLIDTQNAVRQKIQDKITFYRTLKSQGGY